MRLTVVLRGSVFPWTDSFASVTSRCPALTKAAVLGGKSRMLCGMQHINKGKSMAEK